MASPSPPAPCSLRDPRVRAVLDRLFRETARQAPGMLKLAAASLGDALRRRPPSLEREVARLRGLSVPVSPKQGEFLYLVARSVGATRAVEFGSSFGISTLYLAAAVRDNGGGVVVGSELDPGKVEIARRNLRTAGFEKIAEIREGDARETLADPGGSVDLAFLDGFAPLYLQILDGLLPFLRPGSVVLADNVFTNRRALRSYRAAVRDPARSLLSTTLLLKDGTECSVRL